MLSGQHPDVVSILANRRVHRRGIPESRRLERTRLRPLRRDVPVPALPRAARLGQGRRHDQAPAEDQGILRDPSLEERGRHSHREEEEERFRSAQEIPAIPESFRAADGRAPDPLPMDPGAQALLLRHREGAAHGRHRPGDHRALPRNAEDPGHARKDRGAGVRLPPEGVRRRDPRAAATASRSRRRGSRCGATRRRCATPGTEARSFRWARARTSSSSERAIASPSTK